MASSPMGLTPLIGATPAASATGGELTFSGPLCFCNYRAASSRIGDAVHHTQLVTNWEERSYRKQEPMPTVAETLVKTLADVGAKRIYGIVGDSLNGIIDAIRREKSIEWIHVRHEEVAAFAAGADAHVTGELAVCAGSCGPGNLHLINGLFDCHRSGVPVLAIAAQIPSPEIGSGYFQETHPEFLFKDCSHSCQLVSTPAQMPRAPETALTHAIGQRGVAVVVIPGDIALLPAKHEAARPYQKPEAATITPVDAELDRLAELLNQSSRVTLLCGAG